MHFRTRALKDTFIGRWKSLSQRHLHFYHFSFPPDWPADEKSVVWQPVAWAFSSVRGN
jgi:hypothetical protein